MGSVVSFPSNPEHDAIQLAELKTLDKLTEIACTYSATLEQTLAETSDLSYSDVFLMDVIEAQLLEALDALRKSREKRYE
jgi:hypothetical protein